MGQLVRRSVKSSTHPARVSPPVHLLHDMSHDKPPTYFQQGSALNALMQAAGAPEPGVKLVIVLMPLHDDMSAAAIS